MDKMDAEKPLGKDAAKQGFGQFERAVTALFGVSKEALDEADRRRLKRSTPKKKKITLDR